MDANRATPGGYVAGGPGDEPGDVPEGVMWERSGLEPARRACLREAVQVYARSARRGRPLSLPNLRRLLQRCWHRRRDHPLKQPMSAEDVIALKRSMQTLRRLRGWHLRY